MLEERLSPLYPKLARQAVSMTPVEWDNLYYLGEVEPGKASYSSVFYIRESKTGNIVQSNEFPKIYGTSEADYMTQWIKLNDSRYMYRPSSIIKSSATTMVSSLTTCKRASFVSILGHQADISSSLSGPYLSVLPGQRTQALGTVKPDARENREI